MVELIYEFVVVVVHQLNVTNEFNPLIINRMEPFNENGALFALVDNAVGYTQHDMVIDCGKDKLDGSV